jgi:hypothetical protein
MIKLKEIIHRLQDEAEKGLTLVDKWSIPDYDFMDDMGFKPDGQYSFSLKKPHIKVYHKEGVGFVVEDYSKTNRKKKSVGVGYDHTSENEEKNEPARFIFHKFGELTEYFTKYEQEFDDAPYKS